MSCIFRKYIHPFGTLHLGSEDNWYDDVENDDREADAEGSMV